MIIAQITDTHVQANARKSGLKVDTAAGLRACVSHLNALTPRPDVAVMSGDLTDSGTAEDYALARPILDGLAMPYYIIPGNHDHRETFRRVFSDHAYLPREGYLNFAIEEHAVRLIGLDTAVTGEPHGEMCPERLAWLEACLAAEPARPTLLFMHHPPFLSGIRHMDLLNCRNGAALAKIVARNAQIEIILCGHVHRAIEVRWAGTIASIGPSPCHAVALDLTARSDPAYILEPPACRLLTMTDETGLVGHLSYIGAFDGPHPFFNDDGTLID